MLNIKIKTIPHDEQRYPTVGDYYDSHMSAVVIHVSEMANADFEIAVALHEIVEQYLCKKHGITNEAISAFDVQWEKDRADGKPSKYNEPGSDPAAPYHVEYIFATKLEKMFIREMGVNWKQYEECVMNLP